jgi:L-ascorbate metabolism protein UlaG (beta-lactamase superfamily)
MATELFYLRPDVKMEPLVDQWYAWPHLIPPATCARNITERHLKIMDSYISAPQIHANAVSNPGLLGGPFIDYGGCRVDEIRALRDRTKAERENLIHLSHAIGELDRMLREEAKGYSFNALYSLVPEALKGYVELVYDLNNNPSFRLIEGLLYRSQYYDRSAQSLMLSVVTGDERAFVLSTPRLGSDNTLHLRIPFDDERIDELFRLKTAPQPLATIRESLEVPDASVHLLKRMLTTEPPPPCEGYSGYGLRWRYFGHACVLLETRDVTILVDPALSYTYESSIPRYTYQDLPESIDYLIITHNHQDHVLFETLMQIKHKVRCFIVPGNVGGSLQDPSLKMTLQNIGCRNVIELSEMEQLTEGNISIVGIPFLGEHADLNIGTKLAYLLTIGSYSMLFAADSCNPEPRMYEHLRREMGEIDALFVGMECDGAPLSWLYGPLLTCSMERGMDKSRRFAGSDCEQVVKIVDQLKPSEVYIYAMGQEPWLTYIMCLKYTEESKPIIESNRLIRECESRGSRAERLFGQKEVLVER